MNRICSIPFELAHFDLVEMRDHEKVTIGTDREKLATLAYHGVCGTLMYDGRILGIIGYCEMWPGVFEVFILPSKYVSKYAIMFARHVRRLLASLEKSHDAHRFQTSCVADELHDRWMRFMGFKDEGTMEQFSTNRLDYRMWAKVRRGS